MPITIKTGTMKYKKPNGEYEAFNAVAQESTASQISSIQSAGQTQIAAVQAKGTETIASIPNNYTTLSNEVSQLSEEMGNCFISTYSANLWNPDTTVVGQLSTSTGNVIPENTDYVSSDFIPFSTGETVYEYFKTISTGVVSAVTPSSGNANAICLYNASKQFIAGYMGQYWSVPYSISTQNVAYIRIGLNKSHFTNADRIYGIFKSAQTAETFVPYAVSVSLDSDVTVPQIPTDISAFNNDADYVTESVIDGYFIKRQSANLWNPDTTVIGQLSTSTGNVIPENTDYVSSDFIPFNTAETVYEYYKTISTGVVAAVTPSSGNANAICMYNANKEFIRAYMGSNWSIPYEISTQNVAYIRIGLSKAHFTNTDRIYGIFKSAQTADTFDSYVSETVLNPDVVVESTVKNDYALIAYGDSLTAGAGSSGVGYRYLDWCKSVLNARNCSPFGYGGSSSRAIAFTAGALSGYIPPNTRSFALKYADLSTDIYIALNALNSKIVLIDGAEYTISQTENTAYSLPQTYTPATYYKPVTVKNSRYTADIYVIWIGTNDGSYQWDIIDAMIAKLPHKQYVVMGLTRLGTDTTVENEQKAYEKYGSHFFNTRVQIINNAFPVLGETPTADDTTAMNAGLMPPSLLSDEVHFNNDGYEAIGKLLAEHISSLGYAYQSAE